MKKLLILLVAATTLFTTTASAKDKTKPKDTIPANWNKDSLLLALTKEVRSLKAQDRLFKNQLGGIDKKISSKYDRLENLIDQKATAALDAALEEDKKTVNTVNTKVNGMENKMEANTKELKTNVKKSLAGFMDKKMFWPAVGIIVFLVIVFFFINWSKTRGLQRNLDENYEKKMQSFN
jgi:Fe2+ transport system protein B